MKLPADKVNQLRTFYEGREVCVTGGAGFIGGHLCDALISLGAEVRVIDDLSNSGTEYLSGLIELDPDRLRFVHGSILDDDALSDAMRGARTVFHLAAIGSVPRSLEDPQRTWSVNTTGTLRVLEAARGFGKGMQKRSSQVERVIAASSSSVYGNQPELPKSETQPPRPLSPYAASKLAGEHLISVYASCYGLSAASLRFFNIFGPRQSAESAYAAVIPSFTKRLMEGERPVIYGDGEQSRDFTFVGNAVLAALLAGATPTKLTGQSMNIGAGSRITISQLAALIADMCGAGQLQPRFEPARTGDVKHSVADIGLARQLIGYEPVTTLENGLTETVEWSRRTMAGR
ncbi:MAG: GDP-mannose 4,6-dehydratase [Phycisphaerae bacterium]|nr:GDP-mannose 4,6-dehydratase [Phycisphaerae bacterium]